jgi:hypothetical protein
MNVVSMHKVRGRIAARSLASFLRSQGFNVPEILRLREQLDVSGTEAHPDLPAEPEVQQSDRQPDHPAWRRL